MGTAGVAGVAGMRMSDLFLRTLRDDPADADIDSHRLLVRAGYIRRVASGHLLLAAARATGCCAKVEQIVREEMDAAGAQEMMLPIAQPLELWARTGRDATYGPLMFRLDDRKETGFCLSPTAEEVVTSMVAGEYSSYRDLPVNLYQINWKYRDELRPRFGLLRGPRVPHEGRVLVPRRRRRPPSHLRRRCTTRTAGSSRAAGSRSARSKAQAGEIGGDVNHEFMAVAAVGEDDFVWCQQLRLRGQRRGRAPRSRRAARTRCRRSTRRRREKVHTPDLPGHRRRRRAPRRRARPTC